MHVKAVILAGGEGSRLGVLTLKRTKPSVPFAGKYRIIDFALSNCTNSGIYDVMIIAQYRPHSMIEHIGSGGPWDLDREFTGGVRVYPPYKARNSSEWFVGTANAVQQNFNFIKRPGKTRKPDLVLILSGDHIYNMDYRQMIDYHLETGAEFTMATKRVSMEEAKRFGIVGVDADLRVNSFVEKPENPPSDLANMGIYLFNLETLNQVLWQDHTLEGSSHDFGKDILPKMVANDRKVFAYPYSNYWVDVGTIDSYWKSHMDLLEEPPLIDLDDRSWVIHTKTEERPPVRICGGAIVKDSMLSDGCVISPGAVVEHCVLSPGVKIEPGAVVRESVLLLDTVVEARAVVERSIVDKRVVIRTDSKVGKILKSGDSKITTIGKNSIIPAGAEIAAGAVIGTDVAESDFEKLTIGPDDYLQTKRLPYEIL